MRGFQNNYVMELRHINVGGLELKCYGIKEKVRKGNAILG